MIRVSIIIINYNGKNFTLDCLKALDKQSFRHYEIIVVDNGSSDNSSVEIQELRAGSNRANPLKVVSLGYNSGFAGGNRIALDLAQAEYVALLNNDTEPDNNWLENIVGAMDAHHDAGICASKMIVFGKDIIDSASDGYATSLKGFKRGEGEHAEGYDNKEFVFGACAGAALYRRKMLEEIGFFDEDFFLIHEDTDLNMRAQLAGWKILYVPTALVYHKVRSTIGHMSDMAVYYTLRNSEFVRIKNVPFLLFMRCLPEFILGTISEFIYFGVKHGKLGLYLKAKIDVLKKMRSMLRKRKKIMKMKKVSNTYLYSIMTPIWNREFFSTKMKKFFRE